jgi:hypothetical protein
MSTRTFYLAVFLGVVLLAVGLPRMTLLWATVGGSESSQLLAGQSYRALLPSSATDIGQLVLTAQNLDYWIRIQQGLGVTYLKGKTLCTACDPSQEARFFQPPQLYVDGALYWIRLDEAKFRLNLRPAAAAQSSTSSYELIVSPKVDLGSQDLSALLTELAPFGVAPTQTSSLSFEVLAVPSKPQPPAGARLDSTLYGLMVAPDWYDYAAAHGIDLSGLRARVIIELVTPRTLPQLPNLLVEARSDNLIRALVPIQQLLTLADDPAVAFVRLPNKPQPSS